MLPEIGTLLLAITLVLSVLAALPVRATDRLGISALTHAPFLALLQWASIASAFAVLITLFIESDFSVAVVTLHSHTEKPLIFKIAAAWGHHEGSMLLWGCVLASMGALLALWKPHHPLTAEALRTQAALMAGTMGFILWTSNPFARLWPPAAEGQGLNPMLQDIGLALHPPMLYAGYVGVSLVFSLGVAAMRTNQVNREWVLMVRPWVMLAWLSLTAGIGLGCWWAYRELGWGGWWFWDPVENASFVPWLVTTALMHSLAVLEKRDAFPRWTALLATLAFSCSLMGTFLVRSGLLTSVHAFASDPARGVVILALLAVAVGYALWQLAAFSVRATQAPAQQQLISRTNALLLNNLLLSVMAATVLTGIFYPVLLQLFSTEAISVGEPYYLATLSPIALALLLLGGIATSLGWEQTPARRAWRCLAVCSAAAVIAIALMITFIDQVPFVTVMGVAISAWFAAGVLLPARRAIRRWRGAGMVLAHVGMAVFLAAACLNHALKTEHSALLAENKPQTLGDATATLLRMEIGHGPNYRLLLPTIRIEAGGSIHTLQPEIRRYTTEGKTTEEAARAVTLGYDWYGVAHLLPDGRLQLRLMREPAISFVWAGIACMVLGGLCCFVGYLLSPRRPATSATDLRFA